MLVSKSEFAHKWTLTKKNFKAIKEVKGSDEAQLVSLPSECRWHGALCACVYVCMCLGEVYD